MTEEWNNCSPEIIKNCFNHYIKAYACPDTGGAYVLEGNLMGCMEVQTCENIGVIYWASLKDILNLLEEENVVEEVPMEYLAQLLKMWNLRRTV